ncbi:MAG: DUF5717 family protein [Pseudobutyrivibrio sp.]|nr:DUF5717 family protein [Pseudobutyrivibrio sp.]
MRKRIYRISEDKFDDLKPNIEFDSEDIQETCFIGEEFKGSFSFKSTNEVNMKGIVYCNNPYVTIADPWFSGENVRIEYSVNNLNFKVSEYLEGIFTVICPGIEKEIPFKITYTKPSLVVSTGEIHSLDDFSKFAQSRFSEAVALFYSDRFADFISEYDKKTRLLYRGFKGAPLSAVNVDEFLVACGQKETMNFDLPQETRHYYEVAENIKGEIEITRNTWGYIDIHVQSDADFVSVEKDYITADFFLGSIFNMNYYIHKEKMHAGMNYARISFDYRDIHKEIIIMATADKEGLVLDSVSHEKNKLVLKLFRNYEEFRLRRITTGQWCKDTMDILETINDNPENENFILLVRALLFITNKQRQEALWIIQDLKRTIEDKRSTEWAFLLYLCTLIEPEESYVDRLTDNIETIFKEHPDDINIFWFLLFLRKEYLKNPSAKLRDIAEWVESGNETPLLFIEAYYIYLQDTYLINTFDDFTLKVLGWAKKRGAITKDIAIQMIHVLESERVYNPKAFEILEACYEVYPDLQLLFGIVTYILKAETSEEKFLKWYRMAIESNLHISGIFEAYMNALPTQSVDRLPQLVTMFFKYNNELTADRKALLYANIILHKDEDPETYNDYERTIETFALEQLKFGRLDDNLAICYQCLMDMGIFDNEVAKRISELVFKKKIAVISPTIRRVILYQDEFKGPTTAPVIDHQAYINYVGTEGVIFLENKEGYLIADENGYLVEEILASENHIEKLHELSPDTFSFVLEDINKKNDITDFTADDVKGAITLLHSPLISEEYRNSLYPKLIEFMRIQNQEEVLEQHFMEEADLKLLSENIIAEVIDLFISRGKYDEAYYMMQHTNARCLKLDAATRLCQHLISKETTETDDFLITLTADLVSRGSVNNDMVYYLVQHYVGPTKTMMVIYKNAYEKGGDVVEFAERILIQCLYRDFLCEDIITVFDSYMARKHNRMVVEAFLTYEAHDYLVNGADIPERVFAYIFNRFSKAQSVNESMRIALLKFLCLEETLDEEEEDMLDMLMGDSIIRNQYFGFMKNCNSKLKIKYHLYDKYFVEYRGEKRAYISINYSINGSEEKTEDMIEMYDGYYVKQFILFFGDELKYQIIDEGNPSEPLVSKEYTRGDDVDDNIGGRFQMMNDIKRHKIYNEQEELVRDLKKYQGLNVVADELFTII